MSQRPLLLAVLLALGAVLFASCTTEGDADAPRTEQSSSPGASPESGRGTGAVSDFPTGYLDGEWCDSQGLVWTFDDQQFSTGTLTGQLSQLFGTQLTVISIDDDEWVAEQLGERVTFVRAPC